MASTYRSILITGANGFVGSWLQRALRQTRPDLHIIPIGSPGESAAVESLDVRNGQAVFDLIDRIRPDVLIHLAAVSSVPTSNSFQRLTWDVNLTGTMNLAEAVIKHAPYCRFVFVSSSEVYGRTFNTAHRPVTEEMLLDPMNPYAAAKASADIFIGQMANSGLRAVRMRPFNHTGPGQTEVFALPSFAAQIVRIEKGLAPPVLKVGNLEAKRDFLDVRDVVAAYLAAIDPNRELEPGVVLNIASGEARRMGEVLDELLGRTKAQIEVETDPGRMRPSDIACAVGDASRARRTLDWRPQVPWSQTLDEILARLRATLVA